MVDIGNTTPLGPEAPTPYPLVSRARPGHYDVQPADGDQRSPLQIH